MYMHAAIKAKRKNGVTIQRGPARSEFTNQAADRDVDKGSLEQLH